MKKTLAIILAMSLLCMMAVGTTLTYFTDTDSNVNTMVVGKVEIKQIEQKRDANGDFVELVESNGVTSLGNLYPYIGEANLDENGWYDTAKNAVDKIVTVKNTGSEAAYVRTIFAFEMMKKVTKGANNEDIITWESPIADEVILNDNGIQMTTAEIVKGDTHYIVGYYTYNDTLAVGATTDPSLKQVYLDKSVGNEFSDAIGGSYEIHVLSQAVQTQGFAGAEGKTAAQVALDTAFGEIIVANADEIATWFN